MAITWTEATEQQIIKWLSDVNTKVLIDKNEVFYKTRNEFTGKYGKWIYAGLVSDYQWSDEHGMDGS